MDRTSGLIPPERIDGSIRLIRGQKVMLDQDLAGLYGVPVRTFNQAVQRNLARFPDDFMFQLTWEEAEALRSQIVILKPPEGTVPATAADSPRKSRRGQHLKYRPYAFTEQGVAMLSSVLRSERAVLVNVEIMRAFVRMRQLLAANADLARKLDALEKKYDAQFRAVFDAIRQLMAPPPAPTPRRRIGFHPGTQP
jgi:hypothetical protein